MVLLKQKGEVMKSIIIIVPLIVFNMHILIFLVLHGNYFNF